MRLSQLVICGLMAVASGLVPAAAWGGKHHCHTCVVCCCPHSGTSGGQRGEAEEMRGTTPRATFAPVVQAVPYFAMPMAYPAMPVMPAAATASRGLSEDDIATLRSALNRGATRGSVSDCCERVDRLEKNMEDLAKSVKNLQLIVEGQTEVLEKLHSRLSNIETLKAGSTAISPGN